MATLTFKLNEACRLVNNDDKLVLQHIRPYTQMALIGMKTLDKCPDQSFGRGDSAWGKLQHIMSRATKQETRQNDFVKEQGGGFLIVRFDPPAAEPPRAWHTATAVDRMRAQWRSRTASRHALRPGVVAVRQPLRGRREEPEGDPCGRRQAGPQRRQSQHGARHLAPVPWHRQPDTGTESSQR